MTRVAMGFLAVERAHYEGQTYITGDVDLYRVWAQQIHDPASAYTDAKVQYPPGSLPFIVAPNIGAPDEHTYLVRFVVMMALVETLGAVALYVLARRYNSLRGLWVWALALPALGPIIFDRLDLAPAVATILGLVAADASAAFTAGTLFGFATAAKLYPILIFVPLVAWSRSPFKAIAGFVVTILASIAAFLPEVHALISSVLGYHSARGIQVESDWGLGLLFAAHSGYPASVVYEFGSFNVISAASDSLKRLAEVSSIAVTAVGVVVGFITRRLHTGVLAGVMFATLGLVMATGTVLSPQYLVWLAALAAVSATIDRRFLLPGLLLVPMGILTQIVYPFLYGDLLAAHTPELVMLAVRNGLLIVASLWALAVCLSSRHPGRNDVRVAHP